ncbi:MAG TPA: CRISPR-associated endonuclease Cas1 [Thermomicrobiales bacterium]|nr:CRISPR-associated endonuclease Cas1 [Thermomicrobiales bacterium]
MPSLYLTEQGARLSIEAGRLLATQGDDVLLSVPATRVDQVVIVGNVGVTTPALGFLLDRRIPLVFLTAGGAFRGRLASDPSRNMEARRRQYARADDAAFCLAVGRAIVAGKIRNCRTLCLRLDASNADPPAVAAADELRSLLAEVGGAATTAALMGIEGRAARAYFAVFRHFLRPPWEFARRARRPPPDPVNALLSLLYTLLHESCYAALEAAGLDPACGFLHAPRPGRASLALDLMEEFRPLVADSVALTLLNKRMLRPADFRSDGQGGVVLAHDGWRAVAEQYGRRLRTQVRPPGLERRVTYQKLLEAQSRQLKRAIAGEAATYAPFLAK